MIITAAYLRSHLSCPTRYHKEILLYAYPNAYFREIEGCMAERQKGLQRNDESFRCGKVSREHFEQVLFIS
jgi:hypothetical protein